MRATFIKMAMCSSVLALGLLVGCDKNEGPDGPDNLQASGPDIWDREYITITGAFPNEQGTAGNGGTMAYAITQEQAIDPNFELNVFTQGYGLRSQRTARVQGSVNGNFLYNIQYTGDDGGIFNKYKVEGADDFEDTREEVNTEPILGSSPRWVLAGEGIGIGVYASAEIEASAAGKDADFVDVKSIAKIAVLDLHDPQIVRQTEFTIPFTPEQTKDGYQIGRIDVPILNAAKNKIFIGCNLTRTDVTIPSGINDEGRQTWTAGTRELGTATLVVDYPSLSNPKLIYSDKSQNNNHSYRTMTQYVGGDGHVYQAVTNHGTGHQILRINSASNDYDDYEFDLRTALGVDDANISAWRYIEDGIGVVLYTRANVPGGYIAVIDLKAGTATKLSTENETDIGFSGQRNPTITGTFGQFQNIGVAGDYAYVPMTPNGVDGHLYLINWKTKQIQKGAKLKNKSGSFYLGAY